MTVLSGIFADVAIGAVDKSIDFVVNPQHTVDQIRAAPQNVFGR